ncbi:hypothetical protein CDAR_619321, partial [Caerostris darwini]
CSQAHAAPICLICRLAPYSHSGGDFGARELRGAAPERPPPRLKNGRPVLKRPHSSLIRLLRLSQPSRPTQQCSDPTFSSSWWSPGCVEKPPLPTSRPGRMEKR